MRRAGCLYLLVIGVACGERANQHTPVPERSPTPTMPTSRPPPPPSAAPSDDPEARALRERLVADIARRGGPWDGAEWEPRVLDAMRAVPRHLFVPEAGLVAAYRDSPHPIGLGQTISQPTVVAIMTQALELTGRESVLEIGTGSGYQAAVLAVLAKRVLSIEIHEELALRSKRRLAELGYDNVTVRAGDGYAGWPEEAPFERIVLTAAPDSLPVALEQQLAEGGVLVAPVGPEGALQRLFRYRKVKGRLIREDLGGVLFVPMVKGDAGP